MAKFVITCSLCSSCCYSALVCFAFSCLLVRAYGTLSYGVHVLACTCRSRPLYRYPVHRHHRYISGYRSVQLDTTFSSTPSTLFNFFHLYHALRTFYASGNERLPRPRAGFVAAPLSSCSCPLTHNCCLFPFAKGTPP